MSSQNGEVDKVDTKGPTIFEWRPEHETMLNDVINTGDVKSWDNLKEALRWKIASNVAELVLRPADPLPPKPPHPSTVDGLVLPPFKPRTNNPNSGPTRTLASLMDGTEATDSCGKLLIMLDSFEGPPFTIKRICEMTLLPRNHYRTVGKYLRGLERVMLVTSTIDAFPLDSSVDGQGIYSKLGMEGVLKQASTPIFSPIPFLHDDARARSQSPPSPLILPNSLAPGDAPVDASKGLGLVDELDSPAPGHMSTHPVALSAVTNVSATTLPAEQPKVTLSLSERFVKATGDGEGDADSRKAEDAEVEDMVLDDDEEVPT